VIHYSHEFKVGDRLQGGTAASMSGEIVEIRPDTRVRIQWERMPEPLTYSEHAVRCDFWLTSNDWKWAYDRKGPDGESYRTAVELGESYAGISASIPRDELEEFAIYLLRVSRKG